MVVCETIDTLLESGAIPPAGAERADRRASSHLMRLSAAATADDSPMRRSVKSRIDARCRIAESTLGKGQAADYVAELRRDPRAGPVELAALRAAEAEDGLTGSLPHERSPSPVAGNGGSACAAAAAPGEADLSGDRTGAYGGVGRDGPGEAPPASPGAANFQQHEAAIAGSGMEP